MNIAAWLYKGEWHFFTSELRRLVSDQAHYQVNLKEEEKRDNVLFRLIAENSGTSYWFHFSMDNPFNKYMPVACTEDIPKELEILLTIYGL